MPLWEKNALAMAAKTYGLSGEEARKLLAKTGLARDSASSAAFGSSSQRSVTSNLSVGSDTDDLLGMNEDTVEEKKKGRRRRRRKKDRKKKGKHGSYFYADGGHYSGEVKHGKAHGFGKMEFANNDHYEGEFENGMPEGRGHYVFESGDEYTGEFHLGLQHGKGVYRYGKNGTELTADWERGKVCGWVG